LARKIARTVANATESHAPVGYDASMARNHTSIVHTTMCLAAWLSALCTATAMGQAPSVDPRVSVRDGFTLTVAAHDMPNTRFMERGPDGVLYVSQPEDGSILALRDGDGDGYYEKRTPYVQGHPSAHGMDYHDGWLWFTESGRVFKSRDTDGDDQADEVITILDGLPRGGHWWRPVLIHPKEPQKGEPRLYTGIGDSGNITDETDTDRQKLWSYNLQGGDKQLFISGIRNTEKLVVKPGTTEIWGMDHGSDWFGRRLGDRRGKQPITDYQPPDEMNHYRKGGKTSSTSPTAPSCRNGTCPHTRPATPCASTPAISFPRPTAAMRSSPCTAHGTARKNRATAWRACCSITASPTAC